MRERESESEKRDENNASVYFAIPLLLLHDNISLEVFFRSVRVSSIFPMFNRFWVHLPFLALSFHIVNFVYAHSVLYFFDNAILVLIFFFLLVVCLLLLVVSRLLLLFVVVVLPVYCVYRLQALTV